MILVDTSVWVDHFRCIETKLVALLARSEVVQHPFVSGELLLGNSPDPMKLRQMLFLLPQAECLDSDGVLDFAYEHELAGAGIGWVDAHLIASCHNSGSKLWTRDKRLLAQATKLSLAYSE